MGCWGCEYFCFSANVKSTNPLLPADLRLDASWFEV